MSYATSPTSSRPGYWAPRALALVALLVVGAWLLGSVASATAATVTDQRPFLFAFDGSDTSAGPFPGGPTQEGSSGAEPGTLAVDNATGAVYVSFDNSHHSVGNPGFVCKFDSAGNAASFSASGDSCLDPGALPFISQVRVAVDNSGAFPGRIYVSQYGAQRLRAFSTAGAALWSFQPAFQPCDAAVDPAGFPWLGHAEASRVWQYDNDGTAAPLGFVQLLSSNTACKFDFDAASDLYFRYGGGVHKYVGGAFDSTLDASARDVYADQSNGSGNLFTVDAGDFEEYEQSGALVGTFGADYVKSSELNDVSIAYLPGADRVYVLQKATRTDPTPVVAAFGPSTGGTVPDLTIEPAAGVGVGGAEFSGTVDPQGQAGTYHFEWRRATTSWAAADVSTVSSHVAGSSPPQPLPAGPGASPVSFAADDLLRGDTEYEFRLVTVNDGSGLRSVSAAEALITQAAAAPPDVEVTGFSDVSPSDATVEATIDPQGDFADWRVQRSTDPACASGFMDTGPLRTLAPDDEPVAVSAQLSGLLPSERYCIRIVAANSAGSNTSAAADFTTDPIPPSGVLTEFAAPRSDTGARLNGRADPEGEALTYHFEWSADGGDTWQALPERSDASEAREKIVVGQELDGLDPSTTYLYRFVAENPAGGSTGEVASFTTRATPAQPACANAEVRAFQHTSYLPDCRAFELVNDPEKGNQDAFPGFFTGAATEPISLAADGETALWRVEGGAPGGHTPAVNVFRARRSSIGWRSEPIAPPAAEQLGPEYRPVATTSDLGTILARARQVGTANSLLRVGPGGAQQPLAFYPDLFFLGEPPNGQLSADGSRAVVKVEGQLRDIGAGAPGELLSVQADGDPSACTPLSSPAFGDRSVSADAMRVYFWAAPNGGSCVAPQALWVRDRDTQQTTLIDPGTVLGGKSLDPRFITTAADGRSAYFLTHSALDPADENDAGDLYRWEEAEGASRCLTCEADPEADVRFDNGAFIRVLVSADGSRAYFESTAQLTPEASAGHISVYVLRGAEIDFVADSRVGEFGALNDAQLSTDGEALLFRAPANPGLTADEVPAGVQQAYLYRDSEGSLTCVSCRREGATDTAGTDAKLSADGRTVAFVSSVALLPSDVNGGADVYRWRDGGVSLITDGISSYPQTPDPIGFSSDGEDLFLRLVSKGLTGFEHDGLANFYDARVGGGFMPPAPPAHCSGDSCQGPLQAPPRTAPVGSESFRGAGDPLVAPSCGAAARQAKRLGRQARRLRARARSLRRRAERARGARRRAEQRGARRAAGAARSRTRAARRGAARAKRCRRARASGEASR